MGREEGRASIGFCVVLDIASSGLAVFVTVVVSSFCFLSGTEYRGVNESYIWSVSVGVSGVDLFVVGVACEDLFLGVAGEDLLIGVVSRLV